MYLSQNILKYLLTIDSSYQNHDDSNYKENMYKATNY